MICTLLALALHAHFTLFCLKLVVINIFFWSIYSWSNLKSVKKKSKNPNVFWPAPVGGGTQQATNYGLASNPRTQLSALLDLHRTALNCTALR